MYIHYFPLGLSVYCSREMNDLGVIGVKILLTRGEAGKIIGLGGKSIDELRKYTGARIHLNKDVSKERILCVRGCLAIVMNAIDRIIDLMDNDGRPLGKGALKFIMTDTRCKRGTLVEIDNKRHGGQNICQSNYFTMFK